MSPIALGVLRRTLASTDREAPSRRAHAERLLERLGGAGKNLATAPLPPGGVPGYLRLPVLAQDASRRRLASRAARHLGIMPGYPATLSELPGFGTRVRNGSGGFPGARRLAASLFTFPTHGL